MYAIFAIMIVTYLYIGCIVYNEIVKDTDLFESCGPILFIFIWPYAFAAYVLDELFNEKTEDKDNEEEM